MLGINLSGAEFGEGRGTHGVDYTYPSADSIDYHASKGMEVIRLPFLWERVQPTEGGPLDQAELGRIAEVVDHATSKGMKVVLDVHNYGFAYGGMVGQDIPNSSFADLWSKLATEFKGNDKVVFGLMNEPHEQSASQWIGSVNAAVDAIRDAGASQHILVSGSYWDGAHSWVSSDNDTVVGQGVKDPLNNFSFEVHQYFDHDSSGTSDSAVSANVGVERLTEITEWARSTGNKLFLGEFGAAQNETSLAALDNMLGYMKENADVWSGATYWAGGPWWGDYMFSAEPDNPNSPVDKPQMDILEKYVGALGTGGAQGPTGGTSDQPDSTGSIGSGNQETQSPDETPVKEPDTTGSNSGAEGSGGQTPGDTASDETATETGGSQAEAGGSQTQDPGDKNEPDVVEPEDTGSVPSTPAPGPAGEPGTVPAAASSVSISRTAGTAELLREGETMGVTVEVKNAQDGQTFSLWHSNTMNEADFVNSLMADLQAAGLPEGVTVTSVGPQQVTIGLAAGSYSFDLSRAIKADNAQERADQASWWKGKQEQTDIFISDATGGLKIDSNVVSNWVTDTSKKSAAPTESTGSTGPTTTVPDVVETPSTTEPTPTVPETPSEPSGPSEANDPSGLVLTGTAGSDELIGEADHDRLDGQAGNDRLFGGAGDDLLGGGAGSDELAGGDGADQLVGGTGRDILWGGQGDDRFVFTGIEDARVAAPDLVRDFADGDIIGLSEIDANAGADGDQAFAFIGEGEFTAAGQLRFVKDLENDQTFIEANVSGDTAADMRIEVTGLIDFESRAFTL